MQLIKPSKRRSVADNYLYALLVRSLQMAENVRRGLLQPSIVKDCEILDVAVYLGFKEAQRQAFLNEYSVYIVESTATCFILPNMGYCTFCYMSTWEKCIVVPISPTTALYYRKCDNRQGFISVDFVRNVNRTAFKQAERVGGCLIADGRQALENVISKAET